MFHQPSVKLFGLPECQGVGHGPYHSHRSVELRKIGYGRHHGRQTWHLPSRRSSPLHDGERIQARHFEGCRAGQNRRMDPRHLPTHLSSCPPLFQEGIHRYHCLRQLLHEGRGHCERLHRFCYTFCHWRFQRVPDVVLPREDPFDDALYIRHGIRKGHRMICLRPDLCQYFCPSPPSATGLAGGISEEGTISSQGSSLSGCCASSAALLSSSGVIGFFNIV